MTEMKIALSIEETADYTGIGRNTLRKLVERNKLPVLNLKSAINSKAKLAGVAKHNLRKYRSQDYSRDNITLLYGTTNLMQDVKDVYRREFDAALQEYNTKQTRP